MVDEGVEKNSQFIFQEKEPNLIAIALENASYFSDFPFHPLPDSQAK